MTKYLEPFGEVFLHGSRAMAKRDFLNQRKLPDKTDFDYAAQHTQPWRGIYFEAIKNGWEECVDKSYLDNDTAFVFEKIIDGEKIQVSLRQNLERYKDCWNSILPDFYFKYLWKGSKDCLPVGARREFYNSMYCCWDMGNITRFNP